LKPRFNTLLRLYALMIPIVVLLLPGLSSAQMQDLPPLEQPTPKLESGSLTENELAVIDAALATINMQRSDMNFRKDYVDDPYRLRVVQRALDEPLSLIEWNYGWDAKLLEEKSVSELLGYIASDLDSPVPADIKSIEVEPTSIARYSDPKIPESWRMPLSRLDSAVYFATTSMNERVLASLTDADMNFLPMYIPCHFSDVPMEGCPQGVDYQTLDEFLGPIKRFDLSSLISVSQTLTNEVDIFIESIKPVLSDCTLKEPLAIETESGLVLIGTLKNDHYRMNEWSQVSILIDPGGNDVYEGAVAVAGNLTGEANPLVSVVVDFAGDDVYLAGNERSFGSAALGIAELVDVSGNDTYRSGYISQGAGVFGAGILLDKEGNDIYDCDLLGQGAGAIGVGLLVDLKGYDNYRGAMYVQGFGYTRGFGLLTDRHGYDSYYAGGRYDAYPVWGQFLISMSQGYGLGMRSDASGGIGILHDRDGKDYYNAEVFSQGGSYWYGIGALIDDNGNDHYQSEVYSQGAGVHLSVGIMLDRAGNDTYASLNQAQGFAHDYSVGWLIDEGGDDQYTGETNSQGVAVTNSVAGLIDRAGNDGYICRDPNRGTAYSGTTRGYGNIGFLIDMMGVDLYGDPCAKNGGWWEYGNWACGIDVGDDWWVIEKDAEGKEISRRLTIPGVTK